MKILVVLTGGTIGSFSDNDILDTTDSSSYKIIDEYCKKYNSECEFEVVQPVSILSENFTFETLNVLSDVLDKTDFNAYDGIIITHGSDTVSYTAAFMSMMFADRQCPVVFVAANYPVDNEKSNALINFHGAVAFLKSKYVNNGVYFSYANPEEPVYIYLGTRINEASSFDDRFSAFFDLPFGTVEDSEFIPFILPENPLPEEISKVKCEKYNDLKINTLLLKSYTGMNYDYINIDNKKLSNIINIPYHSGTACTCGENTSFTEFIKKCFEKNIKMYIIQKKSDSVYSSTQKISQSYVVPIYNTSHESAYAKISLGIPVDCNVFFEIIK